MTSINFFKIAKFFLFAAPFAVVLVDPGTLFPFIVAKYTFFRAAVELALLAFLAGYLFAPGAFSERYAPHLRRALRSPLARAVAVFAAVFVAASLFAADASMAFWSNFERGEGGFQMLHLFAFFALLAVLFREEDWRRLFWCSITAGLLMVLYGLLASAGVSGFIGPGADEGVRFQGSLGNAAYVGAYLIFVAGFLLFLVPGARRPARRVALGLLLAVVLAFVWFAGTRGPVYGLAGGAVAFFAYLAWRRGAAWRRGVAVGFAAVALAAGLLVYFRGTPFVASLPSARLFNPGLGSSSMESRLWTWESALKGFRERPALGWGPENFSLVFDEHLDPRHYVPGVPSETWYDRAHSVFLDYLVEAGFLGLLSFLAVFVVFFRELARAAPRGDPGREGILYGALFALPVAYLLQGVVLFDILPISLNLFLFLAFAAHRFLPDAADERRGAPVLGGGVPARAAAACLAGAVILGGYLGTYLPYAKARGFIALMRDPQVARSFDYFLGAATRAFAASSPVGQEEYLRFLSNEALGRISQPNVPREGAEALVSFIEAQFRDLVRREGDYVSRTQQVFFLGQMQYLLAARFGDPTDLTRADAYLSDCLRLSPYRPQCLIGLYAVRAAGGDAEGAAALKREILARWPTEPAVR